MAGSVLFQVLSTNYLVIIFTLLVLHLGRNFLTPGARAIPGPLLAKFSDLWRLYIVKRGDAHITHLRLHRKYGDFVRLGPNVVSVNNLETLRTIYNTSGNNRYVKTDFYRVQQQMKNGVAVATLFTSLDEDFHSAIRRPVASYYSMTTLTEFEPFVDSTIRKFFEKIDETDEGRRKSLDIAQWLQFYAFDVIGEMTFGCRMGFLDQGRDIEGIISSLDRTMDYNAWVVGQMPFLDLLFKKNPILNKIFPATGPVAKFASNQLTKRLSNPVETKDFLSRFLDAKSKYPHVVNDQQVVSYTITNVFAGSDTTAITLRAILYYILKTPRVKAKLSEELAAAAAAGHLSTPVRWAEAQKLKYFDCVVKEAMRLHPAIGLLLERVVPSTGLTLPNGQFLSSGTIVGVSPWVIHRNERTFGAEVDSFIPERWHQSDGELEDQFQRRLSAMNRYTFTFGAGSRTCIGKNISLLEIYKLIPTLLHQYEIRLLEPSKDWKLTNSWFVSQGRIEVDIVRHLNKNE